MSRNDAREIAEAVTNQQLQQMFDNAKAAITDWTKTSRVNKAFTIGASWNIFTKGFDVNHNIHVLAKTNMVWEFGEYLPEEAKLHKEPKVVETKPPFHQEPIF